MATAFGTQGATPFSTPTALNNFTSLVGGTPASKALTNISVGGQKTTTPSYLTSQITPTPASATPFNGGSTPNGSFTGTPPNTGYGTNGAPMSVLPSTALKSTTTNNVDGSSTVNTYHAPETGMLNSSVNGTNTFNTSSPTSGGLTPTGTAITPATSTPLVTPPVTPTQTPQLTSSPFAANAQPAGAGAQGLLNTGQSQEQEAFQKAQALQAQLAGSQNNEAATLANMQGNPIPLEFQQGRGNIVQGLYQAQQNALASELQGQSNLAGTGATVAGQGETGLLGAGQLSTPSNQFLTTPYSNQVLDANGQPVNGSGGTLDTAVQNAINQIKAGGGYANAAATLSAFGPAGTNALLSALGPNFNINASNADAASQAANIQTSGTLNTNIGAAGAQQATQNYVAANTAYKTASQQATNLQNTLASTGINNNPQFVNQKINALSNQLGSANYASFITALNETKQAYTSLLSSVGASTPTVNGQQATDIFNENSTPAQINAAIDALNTAAYAKLQPLYEQIGTYSNIGSSGAGSSSGSNFGWNGN